MFKVGDIVYIKKSSKFYKVSYKDSTRNKLGRIIEIDKDDDEMPIQVEWSNGEDNIYDFDDLELATKLDKLLYV